MKSYQNHISKYEDLITTYEETRAGFISMALEKNRRSAPYIEEARVLQTKIKSISNPNDLFGLSEIRNGLIAASGISDKAVKHLRKEGCDFAIQEFIKNFLIPSPTNFKEELVFRFLLTKGDSLGGSMRNLVGFLAQKKLCNCIISTLFLSGTDIYWLSKDSDKWTIYSDENIIDYENLKGIFWMNSRSKHRLLLFNIKIPISGNNIDIVLLNNTKDENLEEALKRPENYLALGELKGGIDSAGADEHWKTGKSALDRIISAFKEIKYKVNTFYIGAAIEKRMAEEIYENLTSNYIQNAANLTKEEQIDSLVEWILNL